MLKLLSKLTFTGLICFLLVEAILRWAFPLSIQKKMMHDEPGLKSETLYERNELGFRSLSMEKRDKPTGTIRIICLGASTTDQARHNTEDMWSGILENKLREKYDPLGINVEVAAWGRAGGRITQRLDFSREELQDYSPDIVITMEGINEIRSE